MGPAEEMRIELSSLAMLRGDQLLQGKKSALTAIRLHQCSSILNIEIFNFMT